MNSAYLMNIAVVDGGAHLRAFARMDNAIQPWDCCEPGNPAPATELTNGGLIPDAGGVAIHDSRRGTWRGHYCETVARVRHVPGLMSERGSAAGRRAPDESSTCFG